MGSDRRQKDDRTALEPLPHGGNLAEAHRLFPHAPKPWIDLSTGINPDAYPLPSMADDVFRRLPSPADLAQLEAVARSAYGAPAGSALLASAGTHPVLAALPRLFARARVSVLAPTYAEHAHAWRRAGHIVTEVRSLRQLLGADVAVLVRPNNPDGSLPPASEMAFLLDTCRSSQQLLVVDEAFIDLLPPGSTLMDHLPGANLLILRSFGKTYGLAGLRLAFAIGRPALIEELRLELGPWPVSGPAIAAGNAALADDEWLTAARERACDNSRWLVETLNEHGFAVSGGALLFHCIDTEEAGMLFDHLGQNGIFVRRFQDQPRRLRIGLPADDASVRVRIEQALQTFQASVR